MIKTDSGGTELWTKTFDGGGGDRGTSVREVSDGGYIVSSQMVDGAGFFKTDSDGNELWSSTNISDCHNVCETVDGGYIVLDVFDIKKLDTEGKFIWGAGSGCSFMSGAFYPNHIMGSIYQISDGGYVIIGSDGSPDVKLFKTDPSGNWP